MDVVCTQHPDSMAQLKVPQLRRILQHVRRKRGKSHQGARPPRPCLSARIEVFDRELSEGVQPTLLPLN
jgi:hypothetical protein